MSLQWAWSRLVSLSHTETRLQNQTHAASSNLDYQKQKKKKKSHTRQKKVKDSRKTTNHYKNTAVPEVNKQNKDLTETQVSVITVIDSSRDRNRKQTDLTSSSSSLSSSFRRLFTCFIFFFLQVQRIYSLSQIEVNFTKSHNITVESEPDSHRLWAQRSTRIRSHDKTNTTTRQNTDGYNGTSSPHNGTSSPHTHTCILVSSY